MAVSGGIVVAKDLTPEKKRAIEELARQMTEQMTGYSRPKPGTEKKLKDPYDGMTPKEIMDYDWEEMWTWEFFEKYPEELKRSNYETL